jgi:hypothetical protein
MTSSYSGRRAVALALLASATLFAWVAGASRVARAAAGTRRQDDEEAAAGQWLASLDDEYSLACNAQMVSEIGLPTSPKKNMTLGSWQAWWMSPGSKRMFSALTCVDHSLL